MMKVKAHYPDGQMWESFEGEDMPELVTAIKNSLNRPEKAWRYEINTDYDIDSPACDSNFWPITWAELTARKGIELIKDYVRKNYSYEGIEDPTQYDGLTIRLVDDVEASISANDYNGLMETGDYILEDEQCAEIVRVVDGKVRQIWVSM